ncbi:acyl-CoA thioesterase [uncultured Planktosalinus sp.]|uniref:acyl-CoA thioesterase n=1 Tax=uncultured Planktosalinus sp. TaxID=1810935 RepID=UPI0030D9219B
MINNSSFPLEIKLRIDWSDLDVYEHVNNVNIIRYLQSARVNIWEKSGLYKSYKETNRGPMLVSSKVDFMKSLFYPGNITIKSRIGFIKNSSFSLEHFILNDKDEVCIQAKDIAVCYDFNKEKTYKIPDDLREAFKGYSTSPNEI